MIPYGLITAELGAAFPTEGATYDWVRLAYGYFAGAVVSVLYCLSNPIWLGGTFSDEIQQEDIAVCEQVQRGLRSRSYNRGRFSAMRENGVHHLQSLVTEFLNRP